MSSPRNLDGNYWGYLINPDKSATPLLTQLCEGLVQIISQLEPGPDAILTPQRLSIFYRSVGGDDYIFRELGYPGLSLVYRTLGCFHSLQPTSNAYEAPSIPCLLPQGFVRWKTLQILLHPDEHAHCMQKAVQLYDIPKPGGGHFPKTIPRGSFPLKPDEEMQKWHSMVLNRLDEGKKRLKNSPYCSPYETTDEGYFPRGSPPMRRTSRPPRTGHKDHHHLSASSGRRSSVPSTPSPIPNPEQGNNDPWFNDQAYSALNSAVPPSPRHRPPSTMASQRHLSHHHGSNSHNTTNAANSNSTSAKSFHLKLEDFIPFIPSAFGSKKSRKRSSTTAARSRARLQSPVRFTAVSTGSDASSEDSLPRPTRNERDRRSPLAPSDYNPYQRRHSHDASYRAQPLYPASFPPPSRSGHNHHSHNQHSHVPQTGPVPNLFRDSFLSKTQGASSSAPGSPTSAQTNPRLRVIDPLGRERSSERDRERHQTWANTLQERRTVSAERRSSGEEERGDESTDRNRGADHVRFDMRREGRPLRVNTVANSGGGTPNLSRVPPISLSGGGRR